MAKEQRCPECGESERLDGSRQGDDIVVTCSGCGHSWVRGSLHCRTCGGDESVGWRQDMTRTPRGNQVSIVGRREVPLCPRCDAEMLKRCRAGLKSVPETYVSAFLFDRLRDTTPPPSAPRAPESGLIGVTRDRQQRVPDRPIPKPTQMPTVRQAIQDYMVHDAGADAFVMLMLGRHLGPSTRLDALDRPGLSAELDDWARTGGEAANEEATAGAIRSIMAYWRRQGWLRSGTG